MKSIGGYFELEKLGEEPQSFVGDGFYTKSARASLKRIFLHQKPGKLYLPYYTCDALIQPLQELNLDFDFYEINEKLEIVDLPNVAEDELLVYVNYFGLKAHYAGQLAARLQQQFILDNTQAFYFPATAEQSFFSVNSWRKYFGVADGSSLHVPIQFQAQYQSDRYPENNHYISEHLKMRAEGNLEQGYALFQKNEVLAGEGLEAVSAFSREQMLGINRSAAANKRLQNYRHLHQYLGEHNRLGASVLDSQEVPFCYPFLPKRAIPHADFWKQQIFVPILWRECMSRIADGFPIEKDLSAHLLPLPIDHRYGTEDMDRILDFIRHYSMD